MFILALLLACGHHAKDSLDTSDTGDTSDTSGDTSDISDTADTSDTSPPADGCRATPQPADRHRDVLVALPYDARGNAADVWAVVTLSTDGELSDAGTRVTMGRSTLGEAVFTPDGSLAIAPTSDGALAVYDAAHRDVVDPAWDGGLYAVRVIMDPSGEWAWVIDGNWENNGGGLWRVAIDCTTGVLSDATRVVEARLPADLLWWGERAILTGRSIPGSTEGDDLAVLGWTDPPTFVAGVDAFGDDEAIVADAAIVGDWVLLADNAAFTDIPNRIARVALGEPLEVASPVGVEDPISMVPFPDGSARALVASGFGDALYVVDADAGTASRVAASGVQLPGAMVAVERGPLAGLVLVSEVGGLRVVRLGDAVVDDGVWSLGAGLDALPGAVGVAP
jgi:hypothetical protein